MLREMLRHSRRSPEKRSKEAGSHPEEQMDRTQEVAGSSPASSIPNPLQIPLLANNRDANRASAVTLASYQFLPPEDERRRAGVVS
jgi:hypothetical protein